MRPIHRRVVVTGLGAVSAAGIGVKSLWSALLEGRSGIGPITRYEAGDLDCRIAGEVRNFDPYKLIEARLRPKRLPRQAQFAAVAAREAVEDAGMTNASLRGRRGAVILGSALSCMESATDCAARVERSGARYANVAAMSLLPLQTQATVLVDMLEMENVPAMSISTNCMGGIDAAVLASQMIRSGRADVVICGGTDAPLSRTPMAEFTAAGMFSTRNEEPERASRPFDRERDNGVLAEGAAIIVLEELSAALARGATPYAELLGEHTCRDAFGDQPGTGLATTMQTAMNNGRCKASEVDYISAWGCGDRKIDRYETEAIKAVFGARAYEIAVGSIKAVTGNPFAAAGPLQLVCAALSFREGLLPPTANYEHGDLDCDLDYIQGAPRRARPRHILLNAHGSGNGNTSVIMGRPPTHG